MKLKLAFWAGAEEPAATFATRLARDWAPALAARADVTGVALHAATVPDAATADASGMPQVIASIWCGYEAVAACREALTLGAASRSGRSRPGARVDAWRPREVARVDAWRVEEVRARSYERDWADGVASPGIVQLSLIRAAEGRSSKECSAHWRQVHRPLALRIHIGLWNYVQDHVVETLTESGGDVLGHAALHFRQASDLRDKLFDSAAGRREIFADIPNFMSLERSQVALMTERWLLTPEELRA